MTGSSVTRSELIHDSATGSHKFVLGALRELRDLQRLERKGRIPEHRKRGRDLERGRGTQSGANRDIAADLKTGPAEKASFLFEHDGDSTNVVTPMSSRNRSRVIQIEDGGFRICIGVHMHTSFWH